MPTRSPALSVASAVAIVLALAAGCLLSGSSQAAPLALNDAQMSAVRGADGTIAGSLANRLSALFSSGTDSTLLTSADFARALAPIGLVPAQLPGYAGQDVIQTRLDAAPISFDFDATSLLRTLGVNTTGASLGTLAMSSFDARGTTIWVWQHR